MLQHPVTNDVAHARVARRFASSIGAPKPDNRADSVAIPAIEIADMSRLREPERPAENWSG
jgi:hypothetical protein